MVQNFYRLGMKYALVIEWGMPYQMTGCNDGVPYMQQRHYEKEKREKGKKGTEVINPPSRPKRDGGS